MKENEVFLYWINAERYPRYDRVVLGIKKDNFDFEKDNISFKIPTEQGETYLSPYLCHRMPDDTIKKIVKFLQYYLDYKEKKCS